MSFSWTGPSCVWSSQCSSQPSCTTCSATTSSPPLSSLCPNTGLPLKRMPCKHSMPVSNVSHRLNSTIFRPPIPPCLLVIDTILFRLGAVHESFEGHPDFELPTTGYVLDLNKSPPQPEKFQVYIETLRSDLKKPRSGWFNIYKHLLQLCSTSS